MKSQLYTLLKVKSREGLTFLECLWMKLASDIGIDAYSERLSGLMYGKYIVETEREHDNEGRELIPSLSSKKFVLTEKGQKELKRVKGWYLRSQACKCVVLLAKGLFYVVSLAGSLYGLIELYEWCIEWL